MNFVGLVSGGKDSIYSICKLIDQGNKLVSLVHISTTENYSDSYMYQTVGTEIASLLGKCFDVPIFIYKSRCKTVSSTLEYSECEGDEVEDLYLALQDVLKEIKFEAVSSGAILSTYQKNRVENVCERLNLKSIAPLWKMDQKELLNEMIEYGIDARIIKVASSFLGKECLNFKLSQIRDFYIKHANKYETNYCGEGGEYESIVLDCPHFKNKISVDSYEIHAHPEEKDRDSGVYFLVMKGIRIINK